MKDTIIIELKFGLKTIWKIVSSRKRMSIFSSYLIISAVILMEFSCSNTHSSASLLETAIIANDWQATFDECKKADSLFHKPETAALMGHAAIMLNKNNESYILLNYINMDSTRRKGWQNWANDFQKKYPKQAIAWYLQGDAYMRNHYQDKAIECFNRALAIDNRLTLAFNARGTLFTINNNKLDSKKDFNQACEIDPGIADFFASRASMFFNSKTPEGAYDDFAEALKINPNFALALNGKASAMVFDSRISAPKESDIDSIFLCFFRAYYQLKLPIFEQNKRNLMLSFENKMYPDLIESPLFRVSDFLDWEGLRKQSINDKDDVLRTILKSELPEIIDDSFLIRINSLLGKIDLFSEVLKSITISDSIKNVISKAKSNYSDKDGSISQRQQFINRLIIEKLYYGLIASWMERKPGMQLTLKRGMVTADDYRRDMSVSNLQDAQNRIDYVYKPAARAVQGIPLIGSAYGKNWEALLDQATEANDRALQRQGTNLKETNPGGVLLDIRRASIDDDRPYFLFCINSLGYEKE